MRKTFKIIMYNYLNIILFIFCIGNYANTQSALEKAELELNKNLIDFRGEVTSDGMNQANENFTSKMREFLLLEGAYNYVFKHLETVAILDSPDEKVRIVNWNVEYPDMSYSFSGFVMIRNNKKIKLYELKDMLDPYDTRPKGSVGLDEWYGALYYEIVPFLSKRKTQYLLIGWDGGTAGSNFKILDVLTINKNTIQFGSPVFNSNGDISKRLIYEYSDKATMTVRFEEKYGRIVMDHLSPEAPSMKELYSYYVPDFSYDAYIFDGEYWTLKEDVIAVNDPDIRFSKEYIQLNPRTGRLERKKFKKGWINPTNMDSEGDIEHVARTPESSVNNVPEKEKEKKKKKKIRRKNKYDPAGLSVTTGKYKRKRKNNR